MGMYYSEDFVEEVRQRNDIVDIISSYVNLKRSGSNYVGLCPFHNEKTASFSVSGNKQMYYCFGCGAGGNVFTFLMEYENLTFPEALAQLAERAGMELPEQSETTEEKRRRNVREQILEIYKIAANYYYAKLNSERGREAKQYLLGRELSEETIRHFGLGYSDKYSNDLYQYMKAKGYDDSLLNQTGLFQFQEAKGVYDKFWNRVMFPIMDRRNKVIAFGGRVMGDGKPKYLNSPETMIFDKSRNLFGLNFVHGKQDHGMIVCEGYMDVIALHQAGFTNAVASLGTAFTEQQANLIRRYTDEVLLTYDSDGAGVKAAMRAIPMLRRAGITGKVIHMEPYKDPDEFIKNLGADEFEKRIEEAQNSFFFEIEVTKRNYSMSDPDQKTKFIHEIARKLLVFEDKIQRNNYLEAVAARYNIKTEDLQQLVVRYGNQMPSGYEEVMEERQQERLRKGRKKELREGISYSYRLLLSWLIEEPQLFRQISQWIKPEDFEEGLYRTVAKELYEQVEKDELEPARIIGHFTEVEEQNKVASMFQTSFGSEIQAEEKKKAITDLILKIKEHSLERQAGEVTDLNELQKLVQQKKMLQGAVKLHIS